MPSPAAKPVAAAVWEKATDRIGLKLRESLKQELMEEALRSGTTLSRHVVTILEQRHGREVELGSKGFKQKVEPRLKRAKRLIVSVLRDMEVA